MKTLQQIFDRVAKHLLKQQVRAVDNISCCYRLGSLSCAVGCLIPKRRYDSNMEGNSIEYAVSHPDEEGCVLLFEALKQQGIDVGSAQVVELLKDLQHVHDNKEPKRWWVELQQLAARYNLKFKHSNPYV